MNNKNRNVSDEFGETSQPSPSQNTNDHSLPNDASPSDLDYYSLNTDLLNQQHIDAVKYFNFQQKFIDQQKAKMVLEISDYKKTLAERENTIRYLQTEMMNFKNNNHILINQYKNIVDKTNSVSNTCGHLNENFTSICERFNVLGDVVNNAKTRQKEVMDLISQTTNVFEEKISNLSNSFEDSLNQVNIEKARARQELETLENKYSLDLITCETSIKELTEEINYLKSENVTLSEKVNEANMKLNKEKENTFNLNQHHEKELKLTKDQNVFLINQNKSINSKYDEIQIENQSIKDELTLMQNSLDESRRKLDEELSIIKEQTELINMLKASEVLNDTLKKDNFTLKERNEYLEKVNTDLMDDISNKGISLNKILEEKENEVKNKCKNYDDLVKMQEKNLTDITQQLKVQREKENKIHSEVLDLKQEIEVCNSTIVTLQDERKANNILIPELQNTILDLNAKLHNTYKKLRDSSNDFLVEKNALQKEKVALEHQNQEHFNEIEKLTANYMKYKTKAKQLYLEVMRLRSTLFRPEQKQILPPPPIETVEIMSDDEENEVKDNDGSIFEFNDLNKSNMNISIHSTSSRINQKSTYLSAKRNSSFVLPANKSIIKKRKTADNPATFQKNDDHIQNNKENNVSNNMNLKLTPLKKITGMNNEVSNQAANLSFTSNPDSKNKFSIPDDLQSSQKKSKPARMQANVQTKSNSTVALADFSSKENVKQPKEKSTK